MKDLQIISNRNVVLVNHTLINDGIHSFLINITYKGVAVLTKMWGYYTIKMPRNKNDKDYKMEVFKTVVDIEKVFKGNQNNFIMTNAIKSFIKALGYELKFPIQKVRKSDCFV
jgi:hypothetical protein